MRSTLQLFRRRNFLFLWAASLVSQIGDWVLIAALPFYIYARTGSALATGGMFIVETLPMIALGSVAGVFVDRWNRKHILVTSDLLQCLLTALLLFVQSPRWFWVIYVVAFVQSIVAQFANPASSAVLPQITGEEQLVTANGLLSVNNNLARLVGPALGGIALVVFDLPGVVLLDAASFLGSGILLSFLVLAPAVSAAPNAEAQNTEHSLATATGLRRIWNEWTAGLRLVRRERWISVLFVVVAIAVLGDGMITVLLAPFVGKTLHANAAIFGWVLTARGLGGLMGGLLIGQANKVARPRYLIGLSALIDGLLIACIVWLSSVPATIVLIAVAGIPVIGFYVGISALLQSGVSDHYRGRIFGSYYALNALMVLPGMLFASFGGDRIGIGPILVIAGGLYVLAGLVALVFLRQLPTSTSSQPSMQERGAMDIDLPVQAQQEL